MRLIEYFIGGAFVLIAIYLFAVNPTAFDTIIRSLSAAGAQTFGTLQGRTVSGGGVSVGGFQR